jgi:malonate decarboxylase gamma subunit
MGGIEEIWTGDLGVSLAQALAQAGSTDRRAALGLARGGRRLAAPVAQAVAGDADAAAA